MTNPEYIRGNNTERKSDIANKKTHRNKKFNSFIKHPTSPKLRYQTKTFIYKYFCFYKKNPTKHYNNTAHDK